MSLAEWQRDLAARVAAPRRAGPSDHPLDGPGLALTRMLQRNWRVTRLVHALPLTMAMLPAVGRDDLLADYCDACPCVSFFPLHEARGLARWLAERRPDLAHAASVAALEVALADAYEAEVFADATTPRDGPHGPLRLARGASRVRFAAPPEQVLAAALARSEPPPVEAVVYELLVAPGISGLARPPTPDERALLDACADGSTVGPPDVVAGLIAAQVLTRTTAGAMVVHRDACTPPAR